MTTGRRRFASLFAPLAWLGLSRPAPAADGEPGPLRRLFGGSRDAARRPDADAKAAPAGAFEIEASTRRLGAGGFPNTSSNPFARKGFASFTVRHRGAVVTLDARGRRAESLWEAIALDAAPAPAVLMLESGIWLARDGDAGPVVTELVPPQAMTVVQWLDAADGQPGPQRAIGLRAADTPSTLRADGTLLLAGGQTVLDVRTLRSQRLRLNSGDWVERLGGFNAGADSGAAPAVALSPGRSQYVVVATRDVRRGDRVGYAYALVAVDFVAGDAYAIPFDRNDTRYVDAVGASRAWLDHHFAWSREGTAGERLTARRGVPPYPWQGSYGGNGEPEYRLEPARPALAEALGEFLRRRFGAAAPAQHRSLPRVSVYRIDDHSIVVSASEERRYVAAWPDNESPKRYTDGRALIERIGRAFNEELATGAHQALFTRWPDVGP